MELALNLVWACGALALISLCAYRRPARISLPAAILLAVLLCLILLPAISLTDDLLAASQATLPLTAHTWRLLAENAITELALAAWLLLLIALVTETRRLRQPAPRPDPLSARLIRALRLRPPPCAA